jgi:hypothetical protein
MIPSVLLIRLNTTRKRIPELSLGEDIQDSIPKLQGVYRL